MQRDSAVFHDAGDRFFVGIGHILFNVGNQFSAIVCIPLARFGWISNLSAKIPQLASPALAGTSETAACANVRLWHKADIEPMLSNVCFQG